MEDFFFNQCFMLWLGLACVDSKRIGSALIAGKTEGGRRFCSGSVY